MLGIWNTLLNSSSDATWVRATHSTHHLCLTVLYLLQII
jgi:hypothetical protein